MFHVPHNLQKERTELQKTLRQVEKEIMFYDKSVQRFEEYQQIKTKTQNTPRL